MSTIKLTKSSPDFKKGFLKALKMVNGWFDITKTRAELKMMVEDSILLQEQMEREATDAKDN